MYVRLMDWVSLEYLCGEIQSMFGETQTVDKDFICPELDAWPAVGCFRSVIQGPCMLVSQQVARIYFLVSFFSVFVLVHSFYMVFVH